MAYHFPAGGHPGTGACSDRMANTQRAKDVPRLPGSKPFRRTDEPDDQTIMGKAQFRLCPDRAIVVCDFYLWTRDFRALIHDSVPARVTCAALLHLGCC